MTTIKKLKAEWEDTEQHHSYIKELFEGLVNGYPELKEHRDFVENGRGFGERSFWWAWKLILDEITTDVPKLLEIGIYKGGTLSLWRLLKPVSAIFGISPLDITGGYLEFNYKADIKVIHDHFNQAQPTLCQRLSYHSDSVEFAEWNSPFDVVYIDGSHEYNDVLFDITTYSPMVRQGGFLVMDDACCDMKMPFGFFQGHEDVTDATLDFMKEHGDDWEFLFNCVHLRIYRKK